MKLLSQSPLIRRPASERGPHAEAFRSWRWVFLAIMLLVAATFGALDVKVAKAQEANGAITGLTLSSDTPGTLPAPRPPTTGSAGRSPARTIRHGHPTTAISIRREHPRN